VYDALTVFGCVIVFLQTLDPSGCLSLQISKAQQPCQGGVVGAQVKPLPIQVLVKMLQGFHDGQQIPTSYTIVSLGLGQGFTEVGYNPFATILYLGQHNPDPYVAGVGVDDEPVRRSQVTQDRSLA
jgi:hypothetical protein